MVFDIMLYLFFVIMWDNMYILIFVKIGYVFDICYFNSVISMILIYKFERFELFSRMFVFINSNNNFYFFFVKFKLIVCLIFIFLRDIINGFVC